MKSLFPHASVIVLLVLIMAGCTDQPTSADKQPDVVPTVVSDPVVPAADSSAAQVGAPAKENWLVIKEFFEEQVLAGRKLSDLSSAEAIARDLGTSLSSSDAALEAGAPTYAVGRTDYEYDNFIFVVYRLESGGTIAGGLELKPAHAYRGFALGTALREYLDPDHSSVTRLADGSYLFGSHFQDDWDLQLWITVDGSGLIQRARFLLGAE